MAIGTEQVDVATCNYCKKREYSTDGTFKGSSGVATANQNGSSFTVNWYSCSLAPSHIGRAVAAAITDGPAKPDAHTPGSAVGD